jgi:hypothetical protein
VGPSALFWVLWTATVALCLLQIADAILKDSDVLGLPLIACAIWLYFYGYMAFVAARTMGELMPTWAMALSQAVALASLLGLLAGWYLKRKNVSAAKPIEWTLTTCKSVWRAGLFLLGVALVGQYSFFGQATIDYKNTSNYWYLMFYVGYPAVGLCVLAIIKYKTERLLGKRLLLGVLILALMWHHILNARRGPLFPMVIVLGYLPYLLARRKPSRIVVLGALALGGIGMLTLVWMRTYTYAPQSAVEWTATDSVNGWDRGLRELSWSGILEDRQQRNSDNEFLYHVGAISTIWQLDDYQYGTGYLELLIHWIPRQLWPNKPSLQQGFFQSHWHEEMPNFMGWGMSSGASSGGIANSFEQFGLLCPVFWYVLGWWASRLYSAATEQMDVVRAMQYVGFLCATHWLLAQGFGAMFVPACYCILIPTAVLVYLRRRRERASYENPPGDLS